MFSHISTFYVPKISDIIYETKRCRMTQIFLRFLDVRYMLKRACSTLENNHFAHFNIYRDVLLFIFMYYCLSLCTIVYLYVLLFIAFLGNWVYNCLKYSSCVRRADNRLFLHSISITGHCARISHKHNILYWLN